MKEWVREFISWCDKFEIKVPRTEQELLELELLDAQGKDLTYIHPNIVYLSNLKRLILDNNLLKDLPKLPSSLLTLMAKNNLFTEFPESIRSAESLRHILLSENMIEEIPQWIGEITLLTSLCLKGNKIKTLEPLRNNLELKILLIPHNQVRDISPIYGFKELEIFDFFDNQVTSFDKRIRGLEKLSLFLGFENDIDDFDLMYMIKNKKVRIYLSLIDNFKYKVYRFSKTLQNFLDVLKGFWKRKGVA